MKSVIEAAFIQLEYANSILAALRRKHELIELIRWAEQKRLTGVQRAYENRLADEEWRLFRKSLEHPHITRLLRVVYTAYHVIKPRPRYHAKGSAVKYRRCNLTPTHRMQYSALQIT